MLAISLAPLALSLSLRHPPPPSAVTHARASPTVALLHELPAGFETLMPAIVDHTPFSRHLFNAIMGYNGGGHHALRREDCQAADAARRPGGRTAGGGAHDDVWCRRQSQTDAMCHATTRPTAKALGSSAASLRDVS